MLTRRPFASALLLTAGFAVSACTAILVPDEGDDGVVRCNNTEDCPDIEDNRYRSQCVFGDGQDQDNSDKVCAADFEVIGCNPQNYDGDHPFVTLYEDAVDAKAAYVACTEENRGKRGCLNSGGSCEAGLELREDGVCDDPNDPLPAIYPPDVGGADIAGQDVMDQFCRSYFCDEEFVCDTSTSNWTCRRCSTSDPFAEGGCGLLYIQGARSSVYEDASLGNCDGTLETEEQVLGTAPEVI
ncbi:hypothetical protein G6O69_13975 [Pseudenhygromyxa sp. WMMC2535]|uniref:hypothetical protein n=1 Tax=Pseudenhygromyxa sp. WMMC2535 TaxID=2712867 RepID=UPI001557824A|nr:hypothetical protein [Pseudenhygromyxa sp. WMMC2535]NVB38945.1 hypothetical protein [Pseudenhygromyxa sp. WMMC2535]